MTKQYKYHYYVKGAPAVLCSRPLHVVTRTTDRVERVNCAACLADPFLADRDKREPVPPQVQRDEATLVLTFTDPELASMFEDWMSGKEISSGWPKFGDWYDGKRD
jgi:hypothetical protein